MRISSRDLRRLINEEIRHSMRIRESDEAAVTGSTFNSRTSSQSAAGGDPPPVPDSWRPEQVEQYKKLIDSAKAFKHKTFIFSFINNCNDIQEQLPKLIDSSQVLKRNIKSVLGPQGNLAFMIMDGERSIFSKAIVSTLADATIKDLEADKKMLAVIAALETGSAASADPASASYFVKTTKVGGTKFFATKVDPAFKALVEATGIIGKIAFIANHDIVDMLKQAADAALQDSTAASTTITTDAATTNGVATTADATTTTAVPLKGWERYDATSGTAGVHDAWNTFVVSKRNIVDLQTKASWKKSFDSFKAFYKACLARHNVSTINPTDMIALLARNIAPKKNKITA